MTRADYRIPLLQIRLTSVRAPPNAFFATWIFWFVHLFVQSGFVSVILDIGLRTLMTD